MLLDVQKNIANLEKTFTGSRMLSERRDDNSGEKDSGDGAGTAGSGIIHKKGLFRYSSFNSDKDATGGGIDRKRQATLSIIL